jgi:flagellar basal body-associated protein FliL
MNFTKGINRIKTIILSFLFILSIIGTVAFFFKASSQEKADEKESLGGNSFSI